MEKPKLNTNKDGKSKKTLENAELIMRWHSDRNVNYVESEEMKFFERMLLFYDKHRFVSKKQFSVMAGYFERG